ncbi:hypothetical protein WN48_08695 [Eufriesea mexicana]|uniref:uncharacterized protein LOC108545981 n=1 Tax=Eufriesea mexicana TaxID=516756 RepID=UPI00083BB112|nr:PREDICTED: uncharacterized protein LOC108545981 [Eufriesea mexicana]OAD59587.1 hypothetical protein WN48_08695 [Eufriesea mexicana]
MLCNRETDRDTRTSWVLYLTLFLFYISVQLSITSSVPDTKYNTTAMLINNTLNNSDGDNLYIIKAMVYEIGILTDEDNTTSNTTERQEEVELSFYNPPNANNGS